MQVVLKMKEITSKIFRNCRVGGGFLKVVSQNLGVPINIMNPEFQSGFVLHIVLLHFFQIQMTKFV